MQHQIADIREFSTLRRLISEFRPEIVIHMAAQPLVRYSYQHPVETYATNVMGTVHVLEAARQVKSVRAIVNVTTDKCYENREWVWGYREDEPMGGHDPYSNSKGCAELVSDAYRKSFMSCEDIGLATARAGNVIGGGDWALDRLIPDTLRALESGRPAIIRNPHATRPWQHVLEPLSGYILLAQRLISQGQDMAEGWNFGPKDDDARPVGWVAERVCELWGNGASWQQANQVGPHEANFLKLDISKARMRLNWIPTWSLSQALYNIIYWHRAWLAGQDMRAVSLAQIEQFQADQAALQLSSGIEI